MLTIGKSDMGGTIARVVGVSLVALVLAAGPASAQSDREGTWEIGGTLFDLSSVNVQGQNGSSLYVDDETGWGFSGAYNFTERLALGVDMTWSDPKYFATIVPDSPDPVETVSGNLDVNVIQIKGIFNLLEEDFTPYFELGGGWTYIDSNVVSGISAPVCWWDPLWGYVCWSYYDTYSDTRPSLNYAVGLRWERDDLILKAAWGTTEIDRNRGEDLELDSIQLTVAWRF